MNDTDVNRKGYILTALFGALGGSLFILFATRAIPKMFSSIMTSMMGTMMSGITSQGGCSPEEM